MRGQWIKQIWNICTSLLIAILSIISALTKSLKLTGLHHTVTRESRERPHYAADGFSGRSWNNLDSASSADGMSQTNEARVILKDSSKKKYLDKYAT